MTIPPHPWLESGSEPCRASAYDGETKAAQAIGRLRYMEITSVNVIFAIAILIVAAIEAPHAASGTGHGAWDRLLRVDTLLECLRRRLRVHARSGVGCGRDRVSGDHGLWDLRGPRPLGSDHRGVRRHSRFCFAGVVALLTTRCYARLSTSYPSRGGTVTFVNRAFGTGLFWSRRSGAHGFFLGRPSRLLKVNPGHLLTRHGGLARRCAVSRRAACTKACGRFPLSWRCRTSYSSASKPGGPAAARVRSNHRNASVRLP